MPAKDTVIPLVYLRKCFDHDPSVPSGVRWRTRPREHFRSARICNAWNARHAGKPAATYSSKEGYFRGNLWFDNQVIRLQTHRVVWALAHGRWPENQIGHINGDRSDNRIANLREATHAENQHNAKKRINNASGYTGVSWIERAGKWRVRINVAKHEIYLGRFDDLNTARRTYLAAKRILHPFAPTPRWAAPPRGLGLPLKLFQKVVAFRNRHVAKRYAST